MTTHVACQKFCCNANLSEAFLAELEARSLRWTSLDPSTRMTLGVFKFQRLFRRFFDLIGAFLLIVVLASPFLVLLALSKYMVRIRWFTPGPSFLNSHRIGKDGRIFTMFKLRTMPMEIASSGIGWGEPIDEKLFGRWGRFLRQAKLDELPQLLNVLIGQMSLVGPRPEMPVTNSAYTKYLPNFPKRLQNTRPGITGPAQLRIFTMRPYDVYRKYRLDMFYGRNQSMIYDSVILLRTARLWARLILDAGRDLFSPDK